MLRPLFLRGVRLGLLAIPFFALALPSAHAQLVPATDVNPDPDIFEAYLTADELDIMIDGTMVHALVYRDDPPSGIPAAAGIPAPEISVKIGDLVIIHLRSELEAANGFTSIHWHGIELDNDSDGTGVTQDQLANGDTHVYRFRVPRAGIFWYHPHMRPAHQEHAGMYGSLIVRDADSSSDREGDLEAAGIIPSNVQTIVLSDINFDAGTGDVGFDVGGTFKTVNEMIEDCALSIAGGVPDAANCGIRRGATVLVNGEKPDSGAMTPMIVARSGEGLRLRLINPSITRYFRLAARNMNACLNASIADPLECEDDDEAGCRVNLYRIGGEGGFLETVRLEGGSPGGWNTMYCEGEILLAPADRADVVLVPVGDEGDIIKIIGRQPQRGMATPGPPFVPDGLLDYDVLFIMISGTEDPAFTIAEGDDVLGAGAIEDLKLLDFADDLAPVPASENGMTSKTIRFTQGGNGVDPGPRIDDVLGHFEDSGTDFFAVPTQGASRYANCGDELELTVSNETGAHHPFHLHGFSMQPVRVLDNMLDDMDQPIVLYEFPYNEFIDNMNIQNGQQLVFRVRLEDREVICDDVVNPYLCADNPLGTGAVGRWVFHCHIFSHAALGMISELVVLPDEEDPVLTCPDDLTVECDGAGNVDDLNAWLAVASATDGCGVTSFTNDFLGLSDGCGDTGSATVTWTAQDAAGNESSCSATFTIEDTTPPDVDCRVGDDDLFDSIALWPPNSKMENVGLSVMVSDICDSAPGVTVEVYSDEDDEEPVGSGNASPDAHDIAVGTLRLRSERDGTADGRVYLIVVSAEDECGNIGQSFCTVTVAHSKGQDAADSVAAQALAAVEEAILSGAPPVGFVLVGDGPVNGPNQ